MSNNELLLKAAKDALNNLFSDTSVDKEVCRENLGELRDEIDSLLESL
jgi:hypothetical protein